MARRTSPSECRTSRTRQCGLCRSCYGRVVQLQLGNHAFDVTTRALVLASVTASEVGDGRWAAVVAEHPAAIEITEVTVDSVVATIERVAAHFDGPISVLTPNATVARIVLSAGADVVHDPTGLADPSYLRVVDEAGGCVIISCPDGVTAPVAFLVERARWADAAGIVAERVVLHAPAAAADTLAEGGNRVIVTSPDDPTAQGHNAAAVSSGARLVASNQVHSTRRTIDTISESLERREPAGVI